jgi:hypothetical protein
VCNGIVPKPPDVGKVVDTTGASETGLVDGTPVGTLEGTGDGTRDETLGEEELGEFSPKSIEGSTEGITEDNVEGITEGCSDSDSEGEGEGNAEGRSEDNTEGSSDEMSEGNAEGNTEGSIEGNTEGPIEGIIEGSTDGDTDGTTETVGRACSIHVHLATGNTVLPSALANAPLDGSWSIEYIKIGIFVSSEAKLSSAVPASHGKVSNSNSWYQVLADTSRASKSLKPLNQSEDGAIIVIAEI